MSAYWLTKPSQALPVMTVNYLSLYLSFLSETTASTARIRNLKKSETIVWKNKVAMSLAKDPFSANDTLLLTSPVLLSFLLFLKSKREKNIAYERESVKNWDEKSQSYGVIFIWSRTVFYCFVWVWRTRAVATLCPRLGQLPHTSYI